MASVALGVAGAFIGSFFGPIGTSIGWMIGSGLGSYLTAEDTFGPRLTDLKIQTSAAGMMIPILFGTIRTSGNLIWSTDLIEHAEESSGKGGPTNTTYSYSCSFAILLCEGPIVSVTRVWADGRLVYDTTPGSDVGISVAFTLYLGDETQLPDPTMEAELGVGEVPAHRGTAYVVFADLPLEDFGNRLPNFTFEVATLGHTTGSIRRLEQNYADGYTFTWGYTPNYKYPAITYWPLSMDGGNIRIKQVAYEREGVLAAYKEFDRATLTLTTTGTQTDQFPDQLTVWNDVACYPRHVWNFHPIGMYTYADGVSVPLWVYPDFPVGVSGTGPAIYNSTIILSDCTGPPVSAGNICYTAGIPVGEYVGATSLSADGTRLFVFTAPSTVTGGATMIDKWYEICNGIVTRQGDVDPKLSIYHIGFGSSSTYHYESSSFENNGRYCWVYCGSEGAGLLGNSAGAIRLYEIDSTGTFTRILFPGTYDFSTETTGGTRALADGVTGENVFLHGSTRVLAEGYAGVVAGDNMAVFCRFPEGEGEEVALSEIVSDLSVRAGLTTGQIDVTELVDPVRGYAISSQGSVRAAVEPLQAAYAFDPVESDLLVKFPKRHKSAVVTIADDDLAASEDGSSPALLATVRQQEVELPKSVNVVYLNADQDYQNGTQLSRRELTSSEMAETVNLPIALTDSRAKAISDRLLFAAWAERERHKFSTSRKYAKYEPGDVVSANSRTIRITNKTETAAGVVQWEGVDVPTPMVHVQGAVAPPGLGFIPPTLPAAQGTTLTLLDIPLLSDTDPMYGHYLAMASDTSDAWRGATVYKSTDAGVTYSAIYSGTVADTVGAATSILGTFAGGNIFDESSSVTVALDVGAGTLSSATEIAVLNGANAALLGDEILQYKTATLTGTRTYVLTGLLRGRRGTEWAMSGHASGDAFVKLPTANSINAPFAELSQERLYKCITVGNELQSSAAQAFTNHGVAALPYAPVHLGGGRDGSQNLTIIWTRRTRTGGAWSDNADVPLGEVAEFYSVRIYTSSSWATIKSEWVSGVATYDYTAAQQVTDFGSTQSTVYFDVRQLGSYGYGTAQRGSV